MPLGDTDELDAGDVDFSRPSEAMLVPGVKRRWLRPSEDVSGRAACMLLSPAPVRGMVFAQRSKPCESSDPSAWPSLDLRSTSYASLLAPVFVSVSECCDSDKRYGRRPY